MRKRKLPDWEDEPQELDAHVGSRSIPAGDQEQDDYMNMTFEDPKPCKSALRGGHGMRNIKTFSKATRNGSEEPQSAQISSKAVKIMQKMGYVDGEALGTGSKGLITPLQAYESSKGRGIGFEAQSAREARERAQDAEDRVQKEETDYRAAVRSDIDESRLHKRISAAQKICETLDTRAAEATGFDGNGELDAEIDPKTINVLWRSRVVHRRDKQRAKSMRQDMLNASLLFSKREFNDDDPEGNLSKSSNTLRKTAYDAEEEEDEDGGADEELVEFEALDAVDRLDQILKYLRGQYNYCFWCGCQYSDAEDLKTCPGETEEAHD